MTVGRPTTLVTGALGCIGAWTVRSLLEDGAEVVAFDVSNATRRLRMLIPEESLGRVRLIQGDLADLGSIERAISDTGTERIIHLGALQLPYCRSDPPIGALVNVVGTTNVFEAARRAHIPHVVYSSSVAIFNQIGHLSADAVPRPASHYGVYKLANEGTARAYWHDFGISSVGIRPMTVYGPGRDRGLTSSPTRAMLAAVLGLRYRIGFGGATLWHHAADVARAFVLGSRSDVSGANVVNLEGVRAEVSDVVSILRSLLGQSAQGIDAAPDPLPFPDDVETSGSELIGSPPVTTIEEGVADTVRFFQDLRRRDALVAEDHGLAIGDGDATDVEEAAAQ